ncbi:Na+(H+)/acetate symporter ActP [Caldalkalibacillus uzonensis]|uniref:Na+(H+)/acetate symporter ActP n=1 Tax=Caldalkalibacillus uzonensis TaxID=353224 RepID=A0ABU0CRZ9_9BACI|nr:Na+(H+)/acetate symporter ActP [Caldalkalibacillus uzonensis]
MTGISWLSITIVVLLVWMLIGMIVMIMKRVKQ